MRTARQAGARGVIAKDRPARALLEAVHELAAGRACEPDPASAGEVRFVPREREILRLVGAGLTNAEIGASLYLAPGTIKHHMLGLYDKLGAPNRAAAVHTARRLGVLGRPSDRERARGRTGRCAAARAGRRRRRRPPHRPAARAAGATRRVTRRPRRRRRAARPPRGSRRTSRWSATRASARVLPGRADAARARRRDRLGRRAARGGRHRHRAPVVDRRAARRRRRARMPAARPREAGGSSVAQPAPSAPDPGLSS